MPAVARGPIRGLIPAMLTALALATPAFAAEQTADKAMAEMVDAKGESVGSIVLQETPRGVLLSLDLEGLPPGAHAFHIHAVGKCDPPEFESAGDHFNPEEKEHGFQSEAGEHAGDLPNVHVPENGSLQVEYLTHEVTLAEGDAASLFDSDGSALVVHAKPDDYRTDPSGDAGGRIACGIVTR